MAKEDDDPVMGVSLLALAAFGVVGAWIRMGLGHVWRKPSTNAQAIANADNVTHRLLALHNAAVLAWWRTLPGTPPATLVVNLVGSFLIGAITAALTHVSHAATLERQMLLTGFLGCLTTFSSFMLELVALTDALVDRWRDMHIITALAPALAHITLHIGGSLVCVVFGVWVGNQCRSLDVFW